MQTTETKTTNKVVINEMTTANTMMQLSIVRGKIAKINARILATKHGKELAALEAQNKEVAGLVKECAKYENISDMKLAGITLYTQNKETLNKERLQALLDKYQISEAEYKACFDNKPTLSIK